jgi:hypothetical protein
MSPAGGTPEIMRSRQTGMIVEKDVRDEASENVS